MSRPWNIGKSLTAQKEWYEENVKILLTQDWFVTTKNPFGKRLESHNVVFRLIEGKPDFKCDDREVIQKQYEEFWNDYIIPFENGDMFITQSGYFYLPEKQEIHILMTGFKEIVPVEHEDDTAWIKNEIENNRHK